MKTTLSIFLLALSLISLSILLTASANGRAFSANDGNTGAPGEGQTCRNCHGTGFGATVNLVIKDNFGFAVSSYVPGTVYAVEVTVNHSSGNPVRHGFQAVTLKPGNVPYNAWSSPSTNARISTTSSGRSYIEHKSPSVSNIFTGSWTAPPAGTGDMSIYFGGVAANGNGGTSGDGGNIGKLTLPENTGVYISENGLNKSWEMFPNPAKDQIQFNLSNLTKSISSIAIRDITGKILIQKKKGFLNEGDFVDVSNLKAGIYLCQLIFENADVTQKKLIIRE